MLPAQPHRTSPYSLRKDAGGWAVFALQKALSVAGEPTVGDGAFGPMTERAVRHFQDQAGLGVDGIAGPATQAALLDVVDRRVHTALPKLPLGVMRGFFEGEGANLLAAVNWSVAGGVDCGCCQYRCAGPPFRTADLEHAFDPLAAALTAGTSVVRETLVYARPHVGCPFTPLELAVLNHNWPFAADQYHRYGRIANPAAPASWAQGYSRAEWCRHYVTNILKYVH